MDFSPTLTIQTAKLVAMQEESDKVYKEMLMYKEWVAQLKEANKE